VTPTPQQLITLLFFLLLLINSRNNVDNIFTVPWHRRARNINKLLCCFLLYYLRRAKKTRVIQSREREREKKIKNLEKIKIEFWQSIKQKQQNSVNFFSATNGTPGIYM